MKLGKFEICYIAPVSEEYTLRNMPVVSLGALAMISSDKPWVQEQVEAAINSVIINPFRTWMLDTWCSFIDVSFVMCLAVAFAGSICGILGIKKGYQAMVLSMVFFCLLRLFSFLMGWY